MQSTLAKSASGEADAEAFPIAPSVVSALAVLGREQLRAATAIAAQEHSESQIFRSALDSALHALCIFDPNGRLFFANLAFAEIYRLPSTSQLAGLSLDALVDLQTRQGTVFATPGAWGEQVRHAVERGESVATEIQLVDGRSVHVSDYPTPDGGWISSHVDLTKAGHGDSLALKRLSLQALIDLVPDNLWVKDVESRFVIANDATALQIGLTSSRDLIGKSDNEIHPPENARQYLAGERKVLESGRAVDFEEFVASGDSGVWILTTKLPLRDSCGEVIGLLGVSRDITARKLAERFRDDQAAILELIAVGAPLNETLERLGLLLERQIAGVKAAILFNQDGGRVSHFGSASAFPLAVLEHAEQRLTSQEDAGGPLVVREFPPSESSAARFAASWTIKVRSPRGETSGGIAVLCREARAPTEAERRVLEAVERLAGIAIERQCAEDRIRFMATHDPLTGLPSRALLKDRVGQAILLADRLGRFAVAAYIDLDNFKYVNDSFGHAAGDELLRTAAQRISALLGPSDSVIRVGGDEFVVVLGDLPSENTCARVALERVQVALAEPIPFGGRDLRITSSIGAACYPCDADGVEALLANADAAMYHAKETGRDNLQFYSPALDLKSNEKLQLREELRTAIRRAEFCLHYQPQIDLTTGSVLAVEALIRWRHPIRGLLPPGVFIPIAEETGMIVAIGEWVIREACRQNAAWQSQGLPAIRMCVNVSARQFRDNRLVDIVQSALAESGLMPEYLELEITESLIMQDADHAVSIMDALKRIGVQMAIDDFGSGYSSLAALKIFPVARLKIDKSFVVGIPGDASDSGVTAAVIALARHLNLCVIAEGVETAEQAEFLRSQHCNEVQGFHYSRPVPAGEFAILLADRNGAQAR